MSQDKAENKDKKDDKEDKKEEKKEDKKEEKKEDKAKKKEKEGKDKADDAKKKEDAAKKKEAAAKKAEETVKKKEQAQTSAAEKKLQKDRSIRLRSGMPEQSNDYRVVVFGAAGVGKSSIVIRFVKGTFRENYVPTIEDTYRQVMQSQKNVCTLQITDTTGSHQFPAMQRLSITKGHAFILVFSITSRQSLEELKPIIMEIIQIKGHGELQAGNIPVMLVGNKCDDNEKREVQKEEGEKVAKAWMCHYIETSAKDDVNVRELFQELLQLDKQRQFCFQMDKGKKGKGAATAKLKGKCALM